MQHAAAWKKALAKGRQVRYTVTRDDRASHFNTGETVFLRHAPVSDIEVGDTVLCQVGNEIRLRRVNRVLSLYGLPCIEVHLGEKAVVSRYVQESACFGKAFSVKERPNLSWWQSLMQRLQPDMTVVV